MQSATGSEIIRKCNDEKQIQPSCYRFRHSATDSGIFYKVMKSATESCNLLQEQELLANVKMRNRYRHLATDSGILLQILAYL